MERHELSDVLARRAAEGRPYLDFIRVPGMSVGLYVLARGAADLQQPHAEDEVYHVVAGRARIRIGDEVAPVVAGSVVYVPADVPHRFEEIEEELRVLVLFAPAESAG